VKVGKQENYVKVKIIQREGKQMEVGERRRKQTVEWKRRKQDVEIQQLGKEEAVKQGRYVEVGMGEKVKLVEWKRRKQG
jgi:hydrogenase maturation factor